MEITPSCGRPGRGGTRSTTGPSSCATSRRAAARGGPPRPTGPPGIPNPGPQAGSTGSTSPAPLRSGTLAPIHRRGGDAAYGSAGTAEDSSLAMTANVAGNAARGPRNAYSGGAAGTGAAGAVPLAAPVRLFREAGGGLPPGASPTGSVHVNI
ncbi:hypothetical protein GCM10010466_07660 [Planomonospora alba]|uniref:Uncharacterized protein n=1 Tax=Planomonospora alba TaxID=161354 RepID=A0ABP6MPJ5_9ACTN